MRNRTLIDGMSTIIFFLWASQAMAESLTSTQTASLKQFGAEQSKIYSSLATCSSDITVNNKAFPNYLRTRCFAIGDTFSYYLYTESNRSVVESALWGSIGINARGVPTATVDSESYRDNLQSKISEKNLNNIEKIITNLKVKQKTKTKEEYIAYMDALLSKLTALKIKYSTSSKVGDIIDYLKAEVIKVKLDYTKDSEEDSFWEELSRNSTSESSENGGNIGSTQTNVPAVTLSVYAGILNGGPKLLTNNDTTVLWTPADPTELNVTFASTNASNCTFDGKPFPSNQVSGSQLYKNLAVGSSHTVQCINSAWKSGDPENGATSKTINFIVKASGASTNAGAADTSLSLTANKTSVKKGDTVNLTYKIWSAFNKCNIFQSNANGQGGVFTPAKALYDTMNGDGSSQSQREGAFTITVDSFDKIQLSCTQPGTIAYTTERINFTVKNPPDSTGKVRSDLGGVSTQPTPITPIETPPTVQDTSLSLSADKTSVKKGDTVNLTYKIWSAFNKCIVFQSNVSGQGGGLTPANALYDTVNGDGGSQSQREGTFTITVDSYDKVQLACVQPGVSGYAKKEISFTVASSKPAADGVAWDGTGPTVLEINRVYLEVFNREGDIGGLRYWDSTNQSIANIRSAFLSSGECEGIASCKALQR